MSLENSASEIKVCRQLSRDQCIQIRTLRRFGLTIQGIANELGFTTRQVQRACARNDENPTPRKGRSPILSTEQVDELEAFVRESPENRQMCYLELAMGPFSHWGCSEHLITNALKKRSYSRCIARKKPPLSAINKQKRLEFAQLHLDWSEEQWSRVLWTDETWVSGDSHMKPRVTRKPDDEFDETCIVARHAHGNSWMFWGSFYGSRKGPFLVWEKEWGSMRASSFCERILPLLNQFHLENPDVLYMQDNAPCHKAYSTIEALREVGITPIRWPPYSPDLNPIESLWNVLRNYIQVNSPEVNGVRLVGSATLRILLEAAWDSIPSEQLSSLVGSMHERCVALIKANGGYTKY